MGNVNPNCNWPQCSCDTQKGEPCRFIDPDFYVRKSVRHGGPFASSPPDAERQEGETKQVGTIDLTPTWTALVPVYTIAIRNASADVRFAVEAELIRMGKLADAYVALQKAPAEPLPDLLTALEELIARVHQFGTFSIDSEEPLVEWDKSVVPAMVAARAVIDQHKKGS